MTDKEKQLASEMIELSEKIKQETSYINTRERIPQLQLDMIVAKIKQLYDKATVLAYLHRHADDMLAQHSEVIEHSLAEKWRMEHEEKWRNIEIQQVNEITENKEEEVQVADNLLLEEEKKAEEKNLTSQKEKYSESATSVNEALSSKTQKTVASSLASKKIEDLRKAIAINQKFAFQKELFGGNEQNYNLTIDKLNSLNDEELEKFVNELIISNKWDVEKSVTKEFIAIIEKRFSKSS